jgi:hypothetical protein
VWLSPSAFAVQFRGGVRDGHGRLARAEQQRDEHEGGCAEDRLRGDQYPQAMPHKRRGIDVSSIVHP